MIDGGNEAAEPIVIYWVDSKLRLKYNKTILRFDHHDAFVKNLQENLDRLPISNLDPLFGLSIKVMPIENAGFQSYFENVIAEVKEVAGIAVTIERHTSDLPISIKVSDRRDSIVISHGVNQQFYKFDEIPENITQILLDGLHKTGIADGSTVEVVCDPELLLPSDLADLEQSLPKVSFVYFPQSSNKRPKLHILRNSKPTAQPIALVDIGTSSVHLSVVHVALGSEKFLFEWLLREKVKLRNHSPNKFTTSYKRDLIKLVANFSEKAALAGVILPNIFVTATSAFRQAENSDELIERLRIECLMHVEVLSGAKEAHLSGLGSRSVVIGDQNVLSVDVGGGSTEIVLGAGPETYAAISIPLGYKSQLLPQEFAEQLKKMVSDARSKTRRDKRIEVALCTGSRLREIAKLSGVTSGEATSKNSRGDGLIIARESLSRDLKSSEIDTSEISRTQEILLAVFDAFKLESATFTNEGLRLGTLTSLATKIQQRNNYDARMPGSYPLVSSPRAISAVK